MINMENNSGMRKWLDDLQLSHPLVIAGPCSAETEEQVLDIARQLKNSNVSVYRAGIWKPRTRPGGFEGVGAIGLKWLQKAKEEFAVSKGDYQYKPLLGNRKPALNYRD